MPGTELAWSVYVPKKELIASGICWKASSGVSESGLPQLSFLAHLGLGGHPSPFLVISAPLATSICGSTGLTTYNPGIYVCPRGGRPVHFSGSRKNTDSRKGCDVAKS